MLKHADEEIKRMSVFVDSYTAEVEKTKEEMEHEYE